MALQLFTDGVTTFVAAQFRRCIGIASSKIDAHVQYATVYYTGSAWAIGSQDSAGITAPALAFATGILTITVSGFAVAPHTQVSQVATYGYIPSINAVSSTEIRVRWYDWAGTLITTASDQMQAHVFLIGV